MISPFVQDCLAKWLGELANGKGISAHTHSAYQSDLRDFFEFQTVYAGMPVSHDTISQLDARSVRAYLAHCQSKGIGASSRARKLSALKSFLSAYYEKHDIKNDAVLSLRGPAKPERLPRPLAPNSAKQAIDTTKELDHRPWVQARDKALLTLLYACGLRISEALSVQYAQTPLGAELRILGKGKKVRIVPVLPKAREMVDHYLALQPFSLSPEDPIFRGIRGGVMSARQAALLMENVRHLLGLPSSATPHAMRHSFASHLLNEGGDIRAIQELLGHKSLSATQIYTKLDEAKLLDVYKDAHPKGRTK